MKKIIRSNEKRSSTEERLRAALAKKPSTFQFTPQGLVVRGKNFKVVSAQQAPRVVHSKKGGRIRHISKDVCVYEQAPVSKKILITGGIGDFMTVESFMTNDQKNSLETIYYATRAHKAIRALVESCPSFPNLKHHVVLYDDWSNRFCFTTIQELRQSIKHPELLDGVDDWSISRIFPMFRNLNFKHEYSSFLAHTLASTSKFTLPETYIAVCPYSPNDRRLPRDFDKNDWAELIIALEKNNTKAVVINIGDDHVPNHPLIVNLSNQSSLPESIEILKGAIGYVGIDSSMSVIATKLFSPENLFIKSVNGWLEQNIDMYFAPIGAGSYVHRNINSNCLSKFMPSKSGRSRSITCPPREITLNTVQGIGDIFWVYQKFSPHYDKINLNILAIADCNVQKRAEQFLHLLPKVGEIKYRYVSSSEYSAVATAQYHTKNIIDNKRSANFACNNLLEQGVRLDQIDPDLEVEWGVKLKEEAFDLPFDKYSIVYVSGNKPQYTWAEAQWSKLVLGLIEKKQINEPIVLLGATYDQPALNILEIHLKNAGVKIAKLINMDFAKTAYTIRNATTFVGYQSGLNILADNFDVRQVMIYFPYLKPMMNSWCKPQNLENGKFKAFTFDDAVDDIVSKINWVDTDNS